MAGLLRYRGGFWLAGAILLALVLGEGWTFALRPVDAESTRLIVRYPLRPDEFFNPPFTYAVFEPAHFVMESGMLLGIKRRAERDPQLSAGGMPGREEAP